MKRTYITSGQAQELGLTKSKKKEKLLADAISKIVQIVGRKGRETMNRIKRLKVEWETYEKLYNEYLTLHRKMKDTNIPPFLKEMKKERMMRIENQLTSVE